MFEKTNVLTVVSLVPQWTLAIVSDCTMGMNVSACIAYRIIVSYNKTYITVIITQHLWGKGVKMTLIHSRLMLVACSHTWSQPTMYVSSHRVGFNGWVRRWG